MDNDPETEGFADPDPTSAATFSVDARGATGVQVGEHATQIIYSYGQRTFTDAVGTPPLVDVAGKIESPYRGLAAFEERDAAFFFGRENSTSEVMHRIARLVATPSLLMVSGVSGSGKSSLLRAGVLPQLRGSGVAGIPGSMFWPCVVLTPGRVPLDELAVRIAPLARTDAGVLRQGLEADPTRFALTIAQAAASGYGVSDEHRDTGGTDQRLVLVVDQFEQVFTHCADEAHRQAFIAALHAAASGHDSQQALVVLAVRADFEARCAEHPLLAAAVQDRYLLTSMTRRQLRMAITEPAKKANSRVDEDLVALLLEEVRTRTEAPLTVVAEPTAMTRPGVLPLLSHSLDQAWRSRTGDILTVADYERTGGIERAIAGSAQRAYDRLNPTQQAIARQVFLRLTAVSGDGVDTADRATRTELVSGRNESQVRDVEAVLESFAAERLLTLATDTVEISHEIVLTAWPLLRDTWLAETHDHRIVRTRLRTTAAEWCRRDRDPSYLYRDSLLAAATRIAEEAAADPAHRQPLDDTELTFLRASQSADHRRQRRRTAVIALLTTLVVGLAAATGVAYSNRQQAVHQRDVAISNQLIAQSGLQSIADPLGAKIESIAAWSLNPSPETRDALLTTAAHPLRTVLADPGLDGQLTAFSPDNRTFATSSQNGSVSLRDVASGDPIRQLNANPNSPLESLAFSPDAQTLATGSDSGVVTLWDVATGHPVRQLPAASNSQVTSLAFSPKGNILATLSDDGVLQLWDVATGRRIRQLPTDPNHRFDSLAYCSNGQTLATSSDDGIVRWWDVATGHVTGQISTPSDEGVVFSPDCKTLAVPIGPNEGWEQLWDVATGHQIGPLTTSDDRLASAAFSPDGTALATGSNRGVVTLWDVATGHQISQLPTASTSQVTSLTFSPDGKILATGTSDNNAIVRLWNVATDHQTGQQLSLLFSKPGHQAGFEALSPDAKTLAIVSYDGVTLWDVATGHQTGQLPTASTSQVTSLTFSPDGRTLVTANGWAGVVQWWDVATGRQIRPPFHIVTTMDSVAFSADGKTLAINSATDNGEVQLWDVATGRQARPPVTTVSGSVVFSPDGRTLAIDSGSKVSLFDVATRHPINRPLTSPEVGILAMAFSPDGKTLATSADSSNGGTVRLWDVATTEEIGQPLASPEGLIRAMAFGPDGKTLTTSGDGSISGTEVNIRLWNVDYLVDPLRQLCTQVGGSVTLARWTRYVPPGPGYRNICP